MFMYSFASSSVLFPCRIVLETVNPVALGRSVQGLTRLFSAVMRKHRVLPAFGRNRPPVSLLVSALTEVPARKPFRIRTYKKPGGRGPPETYASLQQGKEPICLVKQARPVRSCCRVSAVRPLLLHGLVGSDFAVANEDDSVRMLRNVVFVCDQNDRISLAIQILE
jgi:hypothetical protein